MSFLNVQNLHLNYHPKEVSGPCCALKDVSFKVGKGDFVCLLGPNGSGKTSLLRSIAGFEQPHRGTVTIADSVMHSPTTSLPAHRRGVGMVFQNLALFPHLTVRGNIAFGLSGLSSKKRQKRCDEMLDLCGLSHVGDHYCFELSGGLQQRVAIGRALAPVPHILLLDEPFSCLDPAITHDLVQEIRQLLTQLDITTIMVSHNQAQAFEIADHIGVMLNGEMRQFDKSSMVYQTPQDYEVAAFVGRRSFLRCFPSKGGVMSPFGQIPKSHMHAPRITPQTSHLTLAVRADAIEWVGEDPSNTSLSFQVVSKTFQGYYTAVKAKISTGEILEFWVSPEDSPRLDRGKIRLKNTTHCVYEKPSCAS
ncbi:MAG: ABC transporter ATP-binding protein [Proteobacteria bacterium]|nr:ABC transporter ATP-binding protein [Pseudomonadota bacterium]